LTCAMRAMSPSLSKHVFQKKSKEGSKTPRVDMALIKKRLTDAETDYRSRKRGKDEEKGQSH
jgi:hypothetical protein